MILAGNTYYISDRDEVTGPFDEEQIVSLYKLGQVTSAAQVCIEGTEEWVSIRTEINTIEAFKPKVTASMRGAAYATQTASKRSELAAALLTILLVGAGHMYLGYSGRGLCFLLGAVLSFVLLTPIGGLVVMIVAIIDAMRLAREA